MRSRLIPIAGFVLVGGAVLVGLISISIGEERVNPFTVKGTAQAQRLFAGIEQSGAAVGAPTAPVTISVFNDLQCRECAEFHFATIPSLMERLVRPGEATLELRHFSQSRKPFQISATAAIAAGEQDAQWQYAHLFFSNLDEIGPGGINDDFLTALAAAVPRPEFEVQAWQRDFDLDSVDQRVEADAELATDLRLPAGPAVLVDGRGGTIELVQSPSVAEIEAAVAEVVS